jgi:trimeric autotransporter adhesin
MNLINKLFILSLVLLSQSSWAQGTNGFTYQGRILTAADQIPSQTSATIKLDIFNPAGTCLLFSETRTAVNLSASSGYVSFVLGQGTRTGGVDPGLPLTTILSNSASMTGQSSCTYAPSNGDGRKLQITVDGEVMSPMVGINNVPRALMSELSENSKKLGGSLDTDFTKFSNFATCPGGQFLTYNGSAFSCGIPGGGITALAGDVIASGSGAVSATVANVGGVTAANVAAGANSANSATDAATNSALVKRSGTGGADLTYLKVIGPSSAWVKLLTPPGASYNLTLPSSDGSSGQVLTTDGVGSLSWISPPGPDSSKLSLSGGAMTGALTSTANITTSGNVGIGTMTPASLLHVNNGSGDSKIRISSSSNPRTLEFASSGGTVDGFVDFSSGVLSMGTTSAGDVKIRTNSADRLTVSSTGNVGIGTASPAAPLHVNGSIQFSGSLKSTGSIPTINCGGGSPTVNAGSTNFRGRVSYSGTTTSSCTITFAGSFGSAPICVVSWSSATTTSNELSVTLTTSTTLVVGFFSALTSGDFNYICIE